MTLYIREKNEDNVDLLNNALKLCGIFNEDKIIEFIRDNFNKMVDINFVEMLTTFIVEAKKVKMLNRASSATLLERAYEAMFQLENLPPARKYSTLKALCDLVITIATNFAVDMTKSLLKEIKKRENYLEKTFLSTILMLHTFRLTEKDVSLSTINSPVFQQQHYSNY